MAQSERREAILPALYMRRHDTMGNLAHEFMRIKADYFIRYQCAVTGSSRD